MTLSCLHCCGAGQSLTAEQLQWGCTSVSQLQLAGCNGATEAGIAHLAYLPQLHLLDVRWESSFPSVHVTRLGIVEIHFSMFSGISPPNLAWAWALVKGWTHIETTLHTAFRHVFANVQ